MKLLEKRTVNVQVQAQKKSQIDEGMAIATRVDTLRRTLGDLEAQQAIFLSGMENELRKKTQPLHQELSELTREVADLKEQRKKLLEPLNEEWSKVREQMAVVQGKEIYLDERLQLFSEQEAGRKLREKKSVDEARRLEVESNASAELFSQAKKEYARAETVSRGTDALRASAQEDIAERSHEFDIREGQIAAREREISMQNDFIESEKKRLKDVERVLNDRAGTLDRAFKRIKING